MNRQLEEPLLQEQRENEVEQRRFLIAAQERGGSSLSACESKCCGLLIMCNQIIGFMEIFHAQTCIDALDQFRDMGDKMC